MLFQPTLNKALKKYYYRAATTNRNNIYYDDNCKSEREFIWTAALKRTACRLAAKSLKEARRLLVALQAESKQTIGLVDLGLPVCGRRIASKGTAILSIATLGIAERCTTLNRVHYFNYVWLPTLNRNNKIMF